MWYDNGRILSYNKLFNFVIGNRGGGKTFNAKKWCINDYKKNGKEFVWVRRYKKEYKRKSQFFDDIKHLFPDDVLTVKGDKAYINDKPFGTFLVLSVSAQEKSTPYPNVNKIIFDEFVIDKGAIRYLPNEVECFLELYETVARMRDDVRALFLANAISIVNPYFMYWKLRPDLSKRFTKNEHIIVEFFKDTDYIEKKTQTRFGQMVANTNYGNYAIENNFLRDSDTFIEKKTPSATFMFALKYNGTYYGYWVDYKECKIFVNRQYDPSSYSLYSITLNDHEPNLLLIRSLKDQRYIKRVLFAFEQGYLRFEDITVKNQFYEYVQYFKR